MLKPLESGQYEIPLNRYNTNSLIGIFSAELVKELSNELSSFYTENQINHIFESLKRINALYDCTYHQAYMILSEDSGIDARFVLK